jgi:hypothetical protein
VSSSAPATCSAASSVQPPEDRLLLRREQVVAPADRRPQGPLPLRRIARTAGQQRQAPLDPLQNLLGRERSHARRRQLERERQMVEPAADLEDAVVRLEVRAHHAGPREEEADTLLLDERRHRVLLFRGQTERLAARRDDPQVRAGREQLSEAWRRPHHLLEVVEDEQHAPAADVLGRLGLGTKRRADRRHDELRVAHSLEPDPPDAVLVSVDHLGGSLDREAGLPGAAGPGQRQEPSSLVAQELQDLRQLLLPADERGGLLGQVRLVQRLERRKLLVAELVDPLWGGQVLEPMLTEVK